MKLRDLLADVPLEGEWFDPEMEINSISTNEDDMSVGALFVETPGCGLDCTQARNRGVAAAIPGGQKPWTRLGAIAANWYCRPGDRMTIVTVTGAAEGELTAHLLRVMLEGMSHVRVGAITPNGVWINGVALPAQTRGTGALWVQRLLRRMADEGCTHVVLLLDELGLERREFARLRVSVCALTGPTERKEALAELLDQSDTVVLNLDEKVWEDYVSIIPEHTFYYSENKTQADLFAKNLRLHPGHMEFEAVGTGQIQRIHLPVPGGFTIYHGLCVLSCGVCLGLKWDRMARVLRCVRGPKGRLEVLDIPTAYTVVQDRASTPRELERLLTSVREFTAGRLVCVLDCPGDTRCTGLAQMGSVAEQLADRIILTADSGVGRDGTAAINGVRSGMGSWHRPCAVEPDRHNAIGRALDQAEPGDVIVLAGRPDEGKFVRTYTEKQRVRQKNSP